MSHVNSENPRSLRENCIHVTNFAVNKENGAKFVHNESPNDITGNKVRCKVRYLPNQSGCAVS